MDDPLNGQTTTVQRGISGYDWVPANDLIKVVAMVLMVIDHVAWAFSRHPDLWRALGRGSFPLFAALLVVGMRRTRNPRRYLMRLTLFALVSQYPFALCFEGLNIGFTLAIGGLGLYAGEDILERNRQASHPLQGWLGWTASMGAAGIVASLLRTDYGGMGILAMAILQRSPTAGIGIPLMMGWTALFGWLRQWEAAFWGTPVVGAVLLLGWAVRLETTLSASMDPLCLLPRPSGDHRPRARPRESRAGGRTSHTDCPGRCAAPPGEPAPCTGL